MTEVTEGRGWLSPLNPMVDGTIAATFLFRKVLEDVYDLRALVISPDMAMRIGETLPARVGYRTHSFFVPGPGSHLRTQLDNLDSFGVGFLLPGTDGVLRTIALFRCADDAVLLGDVMVENFRRSRQENGRLDEISTAYYVLWDREEQRYLED